MRIVELRLVGVSEDGERLLLTDDSGREHTIALDERLRAAVNGHLSRLGQLTMALESRISPREIQERVRAGESAEHVAVSAGVPLERVLRFVGPVLREREHVVEQARRARLAGSSGPTSLLADVVARAAGRQGVDADDVSWDSARRDDHSWIVTVSWPDAGIATWGLDLLRHQATPVDAAARRISGLGDDTLIALHRSVDLDAAADTDLDTAFDTARLDAGTAGEGNVHLFVPRAVVPADDDRADSDPTDSDLTIIEPEQAATPDADAPGAGSAAPAASTPPNRGGKSARRARVPKWDDIMFGPKSKD